MSIYSSTLCILQKNRPPSISRTVTSFLSPSSSAGQAAARCAVNLYFKKYRKAGQTLEDEIRELIIDEICWRTRQNAEQYISVSVSVDVEGRARREEPLRFCCAAGCASLACRICDVCVFPLAGWNFLGLCVLCCKPPRAAAQFRFMFMCVGVCQG